jgi:indolepyruvate ferredoxin oxidoreductase
MVGRQDTSESQPQAHVAAANRRRRRNEERMTRRTAFKDVTLDDKYDLAHEHVYVTGYQALVRLCLMQKARDRRAGLNTAGYVTGYRGSPLGGLDQQFARAAGLCRQNDILCRPAINEDLAATALWGSQQAELRGEGRYDGVFGMFYAKGPGFDRTGDVFRHANSAGTSRHGGVIALMGDDHTAESSTTAHQSEMGLVAYTIPILNPSGVQEIVDYGLYGWAMSRYAGAWVGLKCLHDAVESTAVIEASLDRVDVVVPDDPFDLGSRIFRMPPGGLNIRLDDTVLGMEARLQDFKRDAMIAFARANRLNRTVVSGGPAAKIGVITTGKSYLDVRQALDDLGLDETRCNELGLRLHKVGCPYPIGRADLVDFAAGLDLIIVVEEKRALIETQLREELYGTVHRPVIVGKRDEYDNWLFPVKGALDSNDIAVAIGERLLRVAPNEGLNRRVTMLREAQRVLAATSDIAVRSPYFCSGCPHNTSTLVPEGGRAYAGIGCHYLAQWMDRETLGFTHMGGEGANWIGEAPFSKRDHVFQNIGDGTYNHSGSMAIRAAIAAGVNVTYKILFNDAVAMTGGQTNDGGLSVLKIAHEVAAAGAKRIAVVADEPGKYPLGTHWPHGTSIRHRDELMDVQKELADIPGCTVMIFDQTCAAEKRRRRKRGLYPDPERRIVINDLVCEGCGDCGVQSNCVSVQPLETEFGRKRAIDQSSCNKDFSCVKGLCPSFVIVEGARLRQSDAVALPASPLPDPALPAIDKTFNVIITGIGGTGVVTIGAVIGMAAHLDGKGVGIIDMAGLAQKGGAVQTHLRIAARPEDISSIRVAAHSADLVLGGDIVVAGGKKVLAAVKAGRTALVVNTAEVLPGEFTRNADFFLPSDQLRRGLAEAGGAKAHFVDATRLATALTGQALGANMFLLGYACQIGALPLTPQAIEGALELNGVAVAMNIAAFRWGRHAANDRAGVEAAVRPTGHERPSVSYTLAELVERRVFFLTAYQDAAYAARYRALVERVKAAEREHVPGETGLARAVAFYLFKLMAYKDEYEIARLYAASTFVRNVSRQFEGKLRLHVHLAPPLLSPRDPDTGRPRKYVFGPWIFTVFRFLAKRKNLRGTRLDPFGWTAERKAERALIGEYETMLGDLLAGLNRDNHAVAVSLASLPDRIRGFGPIKMKGIDAARAEQAALMERFRGGAATLLKAAE